MRIYDPKDYNRYDALKVSPLLLATLLYSVRHLLMVALAYNPKFGNAYAFLFPYATLWFLLTDTPALLVFLAWWQRRPGVNTMWRCIWRSGRLLLTFSLVLQFVVASSILGFRPWDISSMNQDERLVFISLSVSILLIYYLWRSDRVKDIFADFPVG